MTYVEIFDNNERLDRFFIFMINKVIRIERTTEKLKYVKDIITK